MAEAAAAAPEETPKKKGKLLWIIIALLVVGGGGAAAFFLMGGKEEPKAVHAAPPAPAVYYKLEPAFVVNFEAEQLVRFLQVTVEVMSRDPVTVELIKQHDPVIRNDLLMLLGNQTYDVISKSEGKEALRVAALEAVRKIVGREGGDAAKVEAVYFTSFVMQ